MNTNIKLENIKPNQIEKLENNDLLLSIFGGEITRDTSLGYDIGYSIGWTADKVRDGYNWTVDKISDWVD